MNSLGYFVAGLGMLTGLIVAILGLALIFNADHPTWARTGKIVSGLGAFLTVSSGLIWWGFSG